MYKRISGLCILVSMIFLGSNITLEAQEYRVQQGIVEEAVAYISEPDALLESEVIASGVLGMVKTITYTFTADGVLTLSGEGKLSDSSWEVPYFDDIVHVIIEDGITDIGYKTFKGAPKLVSVTMADSVTEIGETAFSGCTSLETVELSNSLTELPVSAFSQCSSLKEITWSENLTSLGDYCFNGCSSLKEIILPKGLTTIGKYCFRECTALEKVEALSSLEEIGDGAFYECTALEEAKLGEVLKTIGESAFSMCTSLEDISLGNQLTALGDYAFSYCSSLKRMIIPDTAAEMEAIGLFNYCSSLEEVVLPEGIKSLGSTCFRGCSVLKEITVPDGVLSLGSHCFSECTALAQVNLPHSIVKLGANCFSNCTALESFPVIDNLQDIQYYCFADCTSLTEFTVSKNVNNISWSAFKNCTNLKKVTWKEGEKCQIGDKAFENCTSLEEMLITNRAVYIQEECFKGCTALKAVRLEKDSFLEKKAFYGCEALKSIYYNVPEMAEQTELDYEYLFFGTLAEGAILTIGPDVEAIPDYLFENATQLKQVNFESKKLKTIGVEAFWGCSQLEEIVLPESLESIKEAAFSHCTALTSVKFGDKMPKLEARAFKGTPWLENNGTDDFVINNGVLIAYIGTDTEIVIPDGVEYIADGVFADNYDETIMEQITKVTIPNSVKELGKNLFEGCSNLQQVILSENLKEIPAFCFSECYKLEQIQIPDNVERLGEGAFWNCTSLQNVTLPEKLQCIADSGFAGCKNLTAIHIPENVHTIKEEAFAACKKLESVTGGEGLEIIESDVFQTTPWYKNNQGTLILGGCLLSYKGDVADVVIPEGIRVICQLAFWDNSALTSVTLPDSLEMIQEKAFYWCINLETVHWGKGLKVIEESAFDVTNLGEEVRFPEGLEKIGNYAICADRVKEVWVPASVTEVGKSAFSGLEVSKIHFDALEHNDILSVMKKYGEGAIKGYKVVREKLENWYAAERVNFTSLDGNTIMSQVARIKVRQLINEGTVKTLKDAYDWVCRNCGYTLEVGYHYSYADGPLFLGVASCQGYALMMKAFLDEMGYPNFVMEGTVTGVYGTRTHAWNNVYIGGSWYHMDATDTKPGDYSTYMLRDTGTHSVEGSNYRYIWKVDIEHFRAVALENYEAPEEIKNPLTYELQEDGTYHVTGCSNMVTEVEIPAKVDGVAVTAIRENAFKNCYYLEKVTIPEGIQSIGNQAFFNCIALKEILLPSTIKELGNGAFDHCISLTMADLSKIKETELNGVFYCCISLRKVRLPKSLEVMDALAFMGCTDTLLDGAPGLEITGYSNTIAETFATENELPFVSLGEGPMSLEKAELTIDDVAYTGEALYPQVTVVLDGVTLKKDVDYSIEYTDNIKVGTGVVTITGIGDYKGKAEGTFEIVKLVKSIEKAKLTIENVTYTGEALYPQVTVVLDGVTLKKDMDYSIEYADNIKVGTGKVSITGIGNYKGKVEGTFKIVDDSTDDDTDNDKDDDTGDDTDDKPEQIFADVAVNSWQYPFAKYAYEKNIMKGKNTDADGKVIFAPNDNLTRAEFAQVLYNAENKPAVEYSTRFHDVPKGQWYANAVLWAAENDIVSGYPNGNYGVSDPITREQLAMMLYKYAKLKGYDITTKADLTGFTDYQSISSWAVAPMEWAVGNSVMKGKKELLDPTGKATRAECATMLTNFMNTFGEK